jgi:hypothetical protein
MYVAIHTIPLNVYSFPINFIMQIYYLNPVVGEKDDKDPCSKLSLEKINPFDAAV